MKRLNCKVCFMFLMNTSVVFGQVDTFTKIGRSFKKQRRNLLGLISQRDICRNSQYR